MSDAYKIRRRSDGLFSTGGYSPSFSRGGKAWATLSSLKSHLTLVEDASPRLKIDRLRLYYQDCDIITLVEKVVSGVV